jgi:hypothetical protein
LNPTLLHEPSLRPSTQHPSYAPTSTSNRIFQVISGYQFDDSDRDFCLNAMQLELGKNVKMRPCKNSFRKQMWYFDVFHQLHLKVSPELCLRSSGREVKIGKCSINGGTRKTQFFFDKARGAIFVNKQKRQLFLGIESNNKYGPLKLFLEGQNESLNQWMLF